MRSLFSGVRRRAVVLAIVALLLVPTFAIADDSQPHPPWPQFVVQPANDPQIEPPHPTVWRVLLVIMANSRFLPPVS